jgi:hypothetical protein
MRCLPTLVYIFYRHMSVVQNATIFVKKPVAFFHEICITTLAL